MTVDLQHTMGQDGAFSAALKAIADAKAARCNLCIGKLALDVWISHCSLPGCQDHLSPSGGADF